MKKRGYLSHVRKYRYLIRIPSSDCMISFVLNSRKSKTHETLCIFRISSLYTSICMNEIPLFLDSGIVT
jgi:hypothetical protein